MIFYVTSICAAIIPHKTQLLVNLNSSQGLPAKNKNIIEVATPVMNQNFTYCFTVCSFT